MGDWNVGLVYPPTRTSSSSPPFCHNVRHNASSHLCPCALRAPVALLSPLPISNPVAGLTTGVQSHNFTPSRSGPLLRPASGLPVKPKHMLSDFFLAPPRLFWLVWNGGICSDEEDGMTWADHLSSLRGRSRNREPHLNESFAQGKQQRQQNAFRTASEVLFCQNSLRQNLAPKQCVFYL